MSDHTRFGLWTLVGIIGWVIAVILALVVVWHLWTDWYPR